MQLKQQAGQDFDIEMNPVDVKMKSEDDEEGEGDISYFLRKPEILKMHLEILYKSVPFISEEKIIQGLEEYKKKKERLRIEKEQRLKENKHKKK